MKRTLAPHPHQAIPWRSFLLLLLPLLFFLLLRLFPTADPQIVAPHQHFNIVSLTAYVAFVVSLFTAISLSSLHDRRTTWLAMGMASMSGIFAVHGLTTPGFLMGPNAIVGAAGHQSLLIGAIFFALSAFEEDLSPLPSVHLRWLWGGWLLFMIG